MAKARNKPVPESGVDIPGLFFGAVFGLALAVLPPLALFILPGVSAVLAFPVLAGAASALGFAASLVASAFLCFGFEGTLRRLEGSLGDEPPFAILRLLAASAVFAYALSLALQQPTKAAAVLVIACAALVHAWLFLLFLIVAPRPRPLRPPAAILIDSVLTSLMLYAGGSATAFWYPLYLLLALGGGLRFGLKTLIVATLANTLGFAAVATTSSFWRAEPNLAAGLLVALVLLPASTAALLRPFAKPREPEPKPEEGANRQEKEREKEPEKAKEREKHRESLALPAPSLLRVREAESVRATTSELLRLFAEESRRVGEAILRVAAGFGEERREPAERLKARTLEAHARALLSRLDDMRDLSLVAVDELAPESEVFDLYEVASAALAMLSAEAAANNRRLTLRVDPRLPYRLVGWSRLFRQILFALVAGALASSKTGNLRIEIARGGRDSGRIRFRIAIRSHGAPAVGPAGVPIIARLVERMEGHLSADGSSLELPFALAEEPAAAVDLHGRLVLIASEEGEFAQDLRDWLKSFNAHSETIGLSEAALREIAGKAADEPILIVDGRSGMLPALSFAYRAAGAAAGPRRPDREAAVLFVASEPHFDPLTAIAEDLLSAILPAPLAKRVLAAALHGVMAGRREVPVPEEGRPQGEAAAPQKANATKEKVNEPKEKANAAKEKANATKEQASSPASVVAPARAVGRERRSRLSLVSSPTPVARGLPYPRLAGEQEIVIEERTVAALRALGEGSDFFANVVDAFRTDSAAILKELRRAAEAGDLWDFRENLLALKSCAANLGGVRLVELLVSLREVTADELRLEGKGFIDRIGSELTQLEAALADTLVRSAGRQ